MQLTAIALTRDDGSVVLFATEEGPQVAVDHRMAQDLVDRIDMEGEVLIEAEPWQVVGS